MEKRSRMDLGEVVFICLAGAGLLAPLVVMVIAEQIRLLHGC